MLVFVGLLLLALLFEATNGAHDTAHACATSVASGALTYNQAVWMSGVCNALGASVSLVWGGATVALFIPKIVASDSISLELIFATLLPGTVWNIWTAYKGRPVSSTHCLLGSLIGAGIASAGWQGVNFHELGLALISLFAAPLIGYTLAFSLAWLLVRCIGNSETSNPKSEYALQKVQIVSAGLVSFAHGNNDGQKTMGIITMLLAATWPASYTIGHVEWWVVALCALAIGIGTIIGAKPTMNTVGHEMSSKKITFYDGACAELVTAFLVFFGGRLGLPLSTTQTCTGSVLGAAKGAHGASPKMEMIKKIIKSWFLTFPITAFAAAALFLLLKAFGI